MIKEYDLSKEIILQKIENLQIEKQSLLTNKKDSFDKDLISQEIKDYYQVLIDDIDLIIQALQKL